MPITRPPDKRHILFVEDELMTTKSFKDLPEDEAYDVDSTHYGEEGMKMILSKKYDLVILDHVAPSKSIDVLLTKLHNTRLRGKLGILTDVRSDDARAEALRRGVNFYVVKSNYDGTYLAGQSSFVEDIKLLFGTAGSYIGPDYPAELLDLSAIVRARYIHLLDLCIAKIKRGEGA